MSAPTFRVRYEHPKTGERSEAVARELSLGGMFVATASPIEEGALLAIDIDLGGANVSVDARVLRAEAGGMRVVFLDLPPDVAATLSAAVTPTSARTVLGVGGATMTSTTPGLASPDEARTPKSVPSVKATTPGIATPAEARVEPKPKVVAEERRESSVPPPPPKSGGAGKWIFLLLLAGGAAAAYVYRDPLRREIEKAIGPEPAPAPSASVQPTPIVEAGAAEAGVDAAADAEVDAAATDAAIADAASEAGARDAGTDAGAKDAGARDAGHPDAGHHDAGAKK